MLERCNSWSYRAILVGLARTICVQCKYEIFGREITKYTVIYGVYIRFWLYTSILAVMATREVSEMQQKVILYAEAAAIATTRHLPYVQRCNQKSSCMQRQLQLLQRDTYLMHRDATKSHSVCRGSCICYNATLTLCTEVSNNRL